MPLLILSFFLLIFCSLFSPSLHFITIFYLLAVTLFSPHLSSTLLFLPLPFFCFFPVIYISSVSLQTVSLKSVDGMGLFAPVRWRKKRELSLVMLWTVSGPSGLLHTPRSAQRIILVMAFNPRLILSELICPFWNSYDLKLILCFYLDGSYSVILKTPNKCTL